MIKKRALSLLLAFVMICSTCLFSASAETISTQPIDTEALKQELQQNIANALAQSGGELYTPLATGDQTSYGLAQIPSGQMLLHQGNSVTTGSTPYMGYFSTSNTLHTWAFEEYIPGSYIVRPASQSSLCLTVNTSTGNVSLQPFSWQTEQYWSPITYGNGVRLLTNSSASAVSGKYLDTSSVSTSGTVYGMIPQTNLYNLSAIYQYGAVIQKGSSKALPLPSYSNSSTFDFSPWVGYSSSNPAICTVSQTGVVTAHETGTAQVLIANAIMQSSYTSPVTVVDGNASIEVLIRYENHEDATSLSSSYFLNEFSSVAVPFEQEFSITLFSETAFPTDDLNGRSGEAALIHPDNDEYCSSTTCGNNMNCNNSHHRSALRLMATPTTTVHIMSIVNHDMCKYGTSHYEVEGLADHLGYRAIITRTTGNFTKVYRHEMSHWLGASDNVCLGNNHCIMSYTSSEAGLWCVNCYNQLVQSRASFS